MTAKRTLLLAWMCLHLPLLAAAGSVKPCQPQSPQRTVKPQGTMLWGTRRDWDLEKSTDPRASVLVSARLEFAREAGGPVTPLKLEGGHLVGPSASPGGSLVGAVLPGRAGDGSAVEVAVCAAEPSPEDPGMVWYRIEAWNARAQRWENPCVGLARVPNPRALALAGVWDERGAHQDTPGQLTFACENGALSKCVEWGYKPWASHAGVSLKDTHQACTRMARADYCGDGRSHTSENTPLDFYDGLGLLTRTTESSAQWDVSRASFEAAWAPDGATCLARTRDGRPLETVLQECPQRLRAGEALELGQGDRCSVRRAEGGSERALLRNQSYAPRAR